MLTVYDIVKMFPCIFIVNSKPLDFEFLKKLIEYVLAE